MSPGSFAAAAVEAYRTSGSVERTTRIPVGNGIVLPMPAGSIVTVALTR